METDYATDEDHDIQYTNSSSPPAADIPNVFTNQVEDIPVQANGSRNDEQYNYPIIFTSQTEIATDNQPAIYTHSVTIQKCSPLHGLDLDVKLNALNI